MAATKSGYEGKIAGLYDLDRTLGKGHFAVVKLARHVFTGQLVAVKVIDKTKLDGMAMGHLLQEVRCMKLVQHPNVVRLYEVIDTQSKLYLILELGDGGDMYDYILRHEGGVAEETAKVHFAQIVRAIAYCHRLHVVHRDLKPENVVFFRQQGTVKLTDFGFSNHFQPGTMLMTSCGSLAYSAPEILLGEEYDAPAVGKSQRVVEPNCRTVDLKASKPKKKGKNKKETYRFSHGIEPMSSGSWSNTLPLHRLVIWGVLGKKQEHVALEADRYNHITATYYLLGERILRDKQEQNGLAPEQRHTERPLSEPLDLVEGRSPQADPLRGATLAPVAPLGSLSPGFPRRGVCESGDLLAPKTSRQDGSFGDFGAPSSCLGLSLRSVAPEPAPTVKSLGALQQICEEEEEDDVEGEEKEQGEVQSAQQVSKPCLEVSEEPSSESSHSLSGSEQRKGRGKVGMLVEEALQEVEEECGKEQESQDLAANICRMTEEHQEKHTSKQISEDKETMSQTEGTQNNKHPGRDGLGNNLDSTEDEGRREQNGPPPTEAPRLNAVQCCLGQLEPSKDTLEDNNNTPSKAKLLDKGVISAPCSSPRSLPKNHCVDLGPDGVEMRRMGGEGEKVEETHTKPQQGHRVSRDAGTDIKNKNVNLRDRLLQFPLCEKALSFNIQPTSKEKLLPFAQYNCCHVL
uniref:non-specific serine/threonine protein kinase n=1 Tax=Astyanax mexicanus TaxID=7994 RepID=A0A8B9LX70_ASTMX